MEYRLEDIFDLQMGKTPSRNNPDYWNTEDNKWISIADLSKCGKYIESTKEYLSDVAVEESGISCIPEDTVVMSFKLSIGKTAITPEPMYSNEAIMSFRDRKIIELLPDYVYYMFSHKDWDEGTNKAVMGKTLNKATLSKIKVNIPEIEEQRSVVEVLDKVSKIIADRTAEIEQLDNLIKSRFVEMFGTIYNNKFEYEIKTLQDVCEQIKDGTHQTPTYTDDVVNGYKFLSSKDVTTGRIDWTHLKYIPEELHNELYTRIAPKKGDILLAKNGTTGIAAVVDRDEIFDIYVSLALLRPINVDSIYLWAAINSVETKQQFDSSLKGIGVPNLHLGEIKKTKIIIPPMNKQNEFADFVHQVDKLKFFTTTHIEIQNKGVNVFGY